MEKIGIKSLILLIVQTLLFYQKVEASQSILQIKDGVQIIYQEHIAIDTSNIENIKNRQGGFRQVGKICYSATIEEVYQNCMLAYKNYNKYWFLMLEKNSDIKTIKEYRSKEGFRFDVIIFNNATMTSNFSDFTEPVFKVNQRIFDDLKALDIRQEKANLLVNIVYLPMITDFLSYFTTFSSIFLSVMLVGTIVWWQVITFRIYRNDNLLLQKSMSILPYLMFVNTLLFLYFYLVLKGEETNPVAVYFGSIISTIDSVYLTFFWFFSYLMAIGFSTYRQSFTREELRRLIFVYVIIYVLICFDQLIEIVIPMKITLSNLSIIDMKNICLNICFCTWILFKSFSTGKKVQIKMTYARLYSPEFVPSLTLKLSLVKVHSYLLTFFSLTSVSIIYIYKVFLLDYILKSSFINMTHVNCVAFLIAYLILFRARQFPQFFFLGFDEPEDHELVETQLNIYKIDLGAVESLHNSSDFYEFISPIGKNITSLELKEIDEENNRGTIPFIILNPIFPESQPKFCVMDYLNIAYKL